MTIDGDEDVERLRRAGRAVAEARDAMLSAVAPGVATSELDAVGRDVLRAHGARSGPQLAVGFPAATRDGLTLRTADGSLAAQFEHTVVVTHGRPLVLTAST